MSVIASPSMSTPSEQNSVFHVVKHLRRLPKVSVTPSYTGKVVTSIAITHPLEYVPDVYFEWSPGPGHFRVYLHVATTEHTKARAGYCICTVGSGLAATGFCALYSFLHKYRARSRSAA